MMQSIIRGTISGTLATLPMTLAMFRLRRRLPREWVKPLPPRWMAGSWYGLAVWALGRAGRSKTDQEAPLFI